jgi:1-acyl-sn-glycerol-3-phosphate acyltransferase
MAGHTVPKTGAQAEAQEAALRYTLARRMVGGPTLGHYARTVAGIALWLLAPPMVARFFSRRGARGAAHALERWWARRMIRHLRIQLDIAGLEHVDPWRSYVVAPLHESFADVLAVLHLPLHLRFVVRDELFTWQFLGPYLRDTGQICVIPERGRWSYRELLRQAAQVCAAGESVVIFPQGTILGIEADFLPGAFALARALSRPILPVVLTGGHRVWEHPYTARLRYGQRMSLRVLAPLSVADLHRHDLETLRVSLRRQLKTVALSGTLAAPRRFIPARDGYWDGYAYRIDPDFPELAHDVAEHRREWAKQQRSYAAAPRQQP